MPDRPDEPPKPFETFSQSHLFRVLSLGFLVLLLQIPVGMVGGLIEERQLRRDDAVADITGKWGARQDVIGPLLVVPYELHTHTTTSDGSKRTQKRVQHATFLAESLDVEGTLRSEVRERGIFEVPLYDAALGVSGRFARPDFTPFDLRPDRVLWDRAVLRIGISDARSIQDAAVLDWGGTEIAFEPGLGDAGEAGPGIHAPLPDLAQPSSLEFAFDLRLHGSGGLYFAPLARETRVSLRSDWPHPSFQGAWLPKTREIDAAGFAARWQVPYLGRSYPQAWKSGTGPTEAIGASRFGVDLALPARARHGNRGGRRLPLRLPLRPAPQRGPRATRGLGGALRGARPGDVAHPPCRLVPGRSPARGAPGELAAARIRRRGLSSAGEKGSRGRVRAVGPGLHTLRGDRTARPADTTKHSACPLPLTTRNIAPIMMSMARVPEQLDLDHLRWGGRRPGAGRRPGPNPLVRHRSREKFARGLPCLVTLKVREDVPSLRSARLVREVERSFARGCERGDFRVVHYSLQGNHAHLIVEAVDREALGRGMKAIGARLARAVNRVFSRVGRVLADRYHVRVLRSPREVRNALRYVLLNARRHAARAGRRLQRAWKPDPASSGRWFDGWRLGGRGVAAGRASVAFARELEVPGTGAVSLPRFWLLREGWRLRGGGRIDPSEVPGRSAG